MFYRLVSCFIVLYCYVVYCIVLYCTVLYCIDIATRLEISLVLHDVKIGFLVVWHYINVFIALFL